MRVYLPELADFDFFEQVTKKQLINLPKSTELMRCSLMKLCDSSMMQAEKMKSNDMKGKLHTHHVMGTILFDQIKKCR